MRSNLMDVRVSLWKRKAGPRMFHLKIWKAYDPKPQIEQLWFDDSDAAATYLNNALIWEPALHHYLAETPDQPTSEDHRRGLVNPQPPAVETIYEGIWDATNTAPVYTPHSVTTIAAQDIAGLETTLTTATEGLHPLTQNRAKPWAENLIARVTVTGLDARQVEQALTATVDQLRESDRLIDATAAGQLRFNNHVEYLEYIAPLEETEKQIHQQATLDGGPTAAQELAWATQDFFERLASIERDYSTTLGFPAAWGNEPYISETPLAIATRISHRYRQAAQQWEIAAVRAERARGASWESIGETLGGMSKQTAWNRYKELIGEDKSGAPHIFLISKNAQGELTREYWFGQPSPVINSFTVGSTVETLATVPVPGARFLVARFLATPDMTTSQRLGTTSAGHDLFLHRDQK